MSHYNAGELKDRVTPKQTMNFYSKLVLNITLVNSGSSNTNKSESSDMIKSIISIFAGM